MSSPAEQYARYQAEKARARTELGQFQQRFDFALDDFQIHASEALEKGRSVLVAAPTGAGKTVVGEFAVHLALASDRKVFYTAPIKALSNQKFSELCNWLGAERVGLLTGDTAIRPEADVVVMTTEVLRNMLYADSALLHGLGFVVMDEVHYLADRLRGPVWEEVIIHLPAPVQLVALSATVSNAEEFGAWLQEVRGDTEVVVSEIRPVPLWQHVLIKDRLLDLFVDDTGEPAVSHGPGAPRSVEVNPEIATALSMALPTRERSRDRELPYRTERSEFSAPIERHRTGGKTGAKAGGRGQGANRRGKRGHGKHDQPREQRGKRGKRSKNAPRDAYESAYAHERFSTPEQSAGRSRSPRSPGVLRRPGVIRALDQEALLPAIFFIFSRAGCDGAVEQCGRAQLSLTTDDERRQIRAYLAERLAAISTEDEHVLGIPAFRRAALNGYAAHHAGIIPLLKSTIEELFAAGLLKVVFATETLALGINMPARSVVLEKLVKFNGVEHADLTPGEYTQLTGRAGRRGIDTEGHAVVLAGAHFDANAVAALASRRTYPLRSAFRPTPNMVVNLLERFDASTARSTLETSFAQFQADRSVVGLARRARELEMLAEDYRGALRCEHGDVLEYAELTEAISEREKQLSQARAARDRDRTRSTLANLRRGEIIAIPGGKRSGYGVVLDADKGGMGGPEVEILTTEARQRTLRPGDLPSSPAVIDSMKIPAASKLSSAKVRKDTASALRQRLSGHNDDPRQEVRNRAPRTPSTAATDEQLQSLREQRANHPVAQCPDLDAHMRWISRYRSTRKELATVERRINGRTSTLARAFDNLCALLVELGYLSASSDEQRDLEPTTRGLQLRTIFSDRDLLIAECLAAGIWEDLDPASLAAIVSCVVHENRRDDDPAPDLPVGSRLAAAIAQTEHLCSQLNRYESRFGVDPTPAPAPGACTAVHTWAQGRHLAAALEFSTLTAGDFVRHCRQVIDLLEQLSTHETLGASAQRAIDSVRRGVVAQEMHS